MLSKPTEDGIIQLFTELLDQQNAALETSSSTSNYLGRRLSLQNLTKSWASSYLQSSFQKMVGKMQVIGTTRRTNQNISEFAVTPANNLWRSPARLIGNSP